MSYQTIPDDVQRIFSELAKKRMTPQEKAEEEKHQQYLDELYSAVNSLSSKIEEQKEMTSDNQKPEWIPCEHLLAEGRHADYVEDGLLIRIGNGRIVSLCKLCTGALSYNIVQDFVRGAMPEPRYALKRK